MAENYGELGEDEPEETSDDMSDDLARSDEYETLRKEVFLALYNLWRIAERHEKAVQEHRDAVLRIEVLLKGSAARAIPQSATAKTVDVGVADGVPGWVFAVGGGVALLLMLVGAAAFFLS